MEPVIAPLRVFTGLESGIPVLVVLHAAEMSSSEMQEMAESHGLEGGFVFPAPASSHCDYEIRFWTSTNESKMSKNVIVGAVWLMSKIGMITGNKLRISAKGGLVEALITRTPDRDNGEDTIRVDLSHPKCTYMRPLEKERISSILSTLGIESEDLIPGFGIQNVATTRVKTLIPIRSLDTLKNLEPEYQRIKKICERIGSTGFYLYSIVDHDRQEYAARQFARHYGYVEDAVNGVAASALSFALLMRGHVHHIDRAIKVKHGAATGSPFEVSVRFRIWGDDVVGCWIGGTAEYENSNENETGNSSTAGVETETEDPEGGKEM
ncbi:hypothetical protein N7457_002109 [Penicillium paradoxum]|uniref:uncharacterized protein n=1 Tax=Penicillium paradoxum TaxID=176176 RepID=UPI002548D291|nr:uncharacterized protein N7457_002109 [Penicillium paradoxum]KAJ5787119.1 hypothetical protein N7457_002109 [Penicillium paradoxum]